MKRNLWITIIVLGIFTKIEAQTLPVIETPKPHSFPQYGTNGMSGTSPVPTTPTMPYSVNPNIQRKNEQMYRQDMQQMQHQQQMIYNNDFDDFEPKAVSVVLPRTYRLCKGTEHYRVALDEMKKMLTGEIPISLKRAVFLTENAYLDNRLDYEQYDNRIKEMVRLCQMKINQKKLNPKDNIVKCMMLFHFMTDTFEVKEMGRERTIVHLPMKYDFEDYGARNDYTKYFVVKLITQNSGQCHSLPLLYLILAEEIGAKANWSMAADHSFVKFKDNKGRWHNIELTSGVILSDYHYMNSGFIKTEAIRNKAFLEPLSKKETIAEVMGDLAGSYARKYGYDEFVKGCADFALQYSPNSVLLHKMVANYYTDNAMYVIERLGVPSVEKLPEYPQAYNLYSKMHESYLTLDQLGYEPVPEPIYQDWLKTIEREKLKPEYQKQSNFYQIVK